jgi:hypothetical protein
MPSGDLICSSCRPYTLHLDIKVPLLENTSIVLFSATATYTLPDDESTAIPESDDNLVSLLQTASNLGYEEIPESTLMAK